MTPYERGFLDCRERAARECDAVSITYQTKEASGAAQACRSQILSLTPEAPDSQPEGVVVPRETLKRWKESIDPFWFSSDGEEEYNNDGVIEVSKEIGSLLAAKEGKP